VNRLGVLYCTGSSSTSSSLKIEVMRDPAPAQRVGAERPRLVNCDFSKTKEVASGPDRRVQQKRVQYLVVLMLSLPQP
jgi:hypothetical protein